ncbi:MAG: hypothetical protein KAJ24_05720, partial [Candidatus Aenigmarchaeota archaeon]|nr:hypothetical protein [Candidatus Aenigmarchaeota archaeon]
FRKGELCSSVSGTARKSDLQPATTMDALPLREIERELLINKSDLSRIQFLGITRELIRGGQPDMFFFAKLKKTYVDFYAEYEKKHSESKREIKKLNMFDFGEVLVSKESCNFRKKFNDLIDIHGNLSSIPLLTNLALWYQYCIKCKS